MSTIFYLPKQSPLDTASNLMAGAKLYFYVTATSTPKDTYSDFALTTPHTNPVVADGSGLFPTIYLSASGRYRVVLKTSADVTLYTQDDVGSTFGTQSEIGAILYPINDAESSASITPTNYGYAPYPYDVRRVGIVPNSSGAATSNTTALIALLNPSNIGPIGNYIFPNTSGADVYYFNNMVQVRSGSRINLNGCTLNFAKTYAAADNFMGFFTFIQDVTIENGNIVVNYDGSAGTNAGSVMRIGSRNGYPFGTYTSGATGENLTTPMGGIILRNLRLTSNNPGAAMILALGGIEGLIHENIFYDGQSSAPRGWYYEFGHYHYEATAANIKSSHARNMKFVNTKVQNTTSSAFSLVGAISATVEGLHADGCVNSVVCRSGEALFYNMGTPYVGQKPHIQLKDINIINDTGTGILLQGAESASGGYLSSVISGLGHPGDYVAQTGLIRFSLDGFSVSAGAVGLNVSGNINARNGSLHGASTSGQLIVTDECIHSCFTNIRIVDSSNVGVRASFGSAIWSPARLKQIEMHGCLVGGNTGAGISIGNAQSAKIVNCRLGYSSLYEAADESVQTFGVTVASTGNGVICEGNFVTTSGGNAAYRNQGTGSQGSSISNPGGLNTLSGTWERDGMTFATSAAIIDKTNIVNTQNKYLGRRCWDSSNTRLMIAQGATDVSTWKVCDNSATVTPV